MHWIVQLMLWTGTFMVITGACVVTGWAWASADTLLKFTAAIILTGLVLTLTPIIIGAIATFTQEP